MSVSVDGAGEDHFKGRAVTIICPVHQKKQNLKYVQPPRPKSCAPKHEYLGPDHPLDADTIYHLSYPPVDSSTAQQCRPAPIAAQGNIHLPDGRVEDRTVTNQSYIYTPQQPREPIIPKSRDMLGAGPMQSVTTQRHDYTPKATEKQQQFVPVGNIYPINAKMEDATIMMQSYLPLGRPDPPKSCKPESKYQMPEQPLESSTIQQLSYVAPELPIKENFPWAMKSQYQQPQHRMEGSTIYNGSFVAPGVFEPVKSSPITCPAGRCMCANSATEDLH